MSFSGEYKKLNAEQQAAVDQIDGPLMVIAGPGTGKTQLLSLRVANILQKTDISASSILCLTFTNKAATNMQERLLNLIGPDATQVAVRTFHSFAAEVMNRHPEYFWSGARLAIAPDAVQLEIIQEILNKLPPDHPLALKFAGQFTLIKDVQNAVNLAKEAGFTPDNLRTAIKANLTYLETIEPDMAEIAALRVSAKNIQTIAERVVALPEQPITELPEPSKGLDIIIKDSFQAAVNQALETGKNTAISSWKRRWIQRVDEAYRLANERRRNEWWLAVADVYEQYRKQLHRRGYYDYADMLVEVISQVQAHSNLRAELQEQYQYVLIDEFQDTNAAQLQLAHLVADHFTSEGNPNLMVVGDDDQSIFKFQGAELSNMLDFTRRYPSATVVVLTKNYRSTQPILDVSSRMIEHASYRLIEALPGVSKNLTAQTQAKAGTIEHQRFTSRPEQLSAVAAAVGALHARGQSVAVLARSHGSLRDMANVLTQQGIAIRYEQSNNIFERDGVSQILILLRLIVAIGKGDAALVSELLSQSLSHPMWQLPAATLWKFAITHRSNHDWYSGLLETDDTQLKAVGEWLAHLVKLSSHESATVVLEEIIGLRQTQDRLNPFKEYFLAQTKVNQQYLETLAALQLLRTLVIEFCSNRQPKVSEFVAFANLMEQNSRVLADTTPFQSGERFVELLSVHKAKGLEFDAVVIIDATHDDWSPRAKGRQPPANLPLRPADDDHDDYVRLMYVAATRARQTLLLASYKQSIKGEDMLASPIIEALPMQEPAPQRGIELQRSLELTLSWPRLEQPDEKRLLKAWLENYSMSATHLLNFLDVTRGGPRYFFDRNVLRLPMAQSPAAALGTAIHDCLQLAQNLVNQGDFSKTAVQDQFEQSLQLQSLAHTDYTKQLARGKRILEHLFDSLHFMPTLNAKPEYAIQGVQAGQAILNGKLDVLYSHDDLTRISDYKTGRPVLSLHAKAGDEGVRAWKHRTQLVFYALLAQLSPSINSKDLSCEILYVEAPNQKEFVRSYTPSPDEITRLSSLIQAVWKHITDLEFPQVTAYPDSLQGIEAFQQDLLDGKI